MLKSSDALHRLLPCELSHARAVRAPTEPGSSKINPASAQEPAQFLPQHSSGESGMGDASSGTAEERLQALSSDVRGGSETAHVLDAVPSAAVLVQVVRPDWADAPHVLARDDHGRQRARLHAEAERIHCNEQTSANMRQDDSRVG